MLRSINIRKEIRQPVTVIDNITLLFQMHIYELTDGREYAYASWQGDTHNGAADYVYINGLFANKLKLQDKLQVSSKFQF